MTAITAHGATYATAAEARARLDVLADENARYGASDGRVTEANAIREAIAKAALADGSDEAVDAAFAAINAEPVYTVEREEFEVPCDHPMCAMLHRRFFTGTERGTEWVSLPNGEDRLLNVTGSHFKIRSQWIILRDGKRVGDAYDTKREALGEAARKPVH